MTTCLVIAAVPRTIDLFLGPHMQQLRNLGMEVHVASSGCPAEAETQRLPYHAVPFSRSAFDLIGHWRAWRSCRQLLDQLAADGEPLLLHLHTPIAAALARLALRRGHRARVLYMAHGFHFLPGERNVYYWIERALARFTDLYVLINEDDVISARALCQDDPDRWTKIPGVGLQRVSSKRPPPATQMTPASASAEQALPAVAACPAIAASSELHTSIRDAPPTALKRVLVLGVLEARKHPELALRAAAQLDEHTHVHFCGDGPLEPRLQELATELGCAHRVHFEGWTDKVAPWFEQADCLLFLSEREGLPMAVAEALISRLAVVAFDIRGVRDLLQGLTGWHIPAARSPAAVARAITQALATSVDEVAYHRRATSFSLAASLEAHGAAVQRLTGPVRHRPANDASYPSAISLGNGPSVTTLTRQPRRHASGRPSSGSTTSPAPAFRTTGTPGQ